MNTYTKINSDSISIRNAENNEIIASVLFNKAYDETNERTLYLIESADTNENYQRQGFYTKALTEFAASKFDDTSFFASIGRSYEAAMFWAKKLNMDKDEVEADVEKDQQERALIIDFELDLTSNEPADELIDLFF